MIIHDIRHKRLWLYLEAVDSALLPPAAVSKIRTMLSYLQNMATEQEIHSVPGWKATNSPAAAKARGRYVTKNWRIAFQIDRQQIKIVDLDHEDYHQEPIWQAKV
jgi:toxin HigB-1